MTDEDWQNDEATALFDAIVRLENTGQVAAFLRDLCTRRELEEMIQRWAVARLLDEGHTYRDIAERTGVSTATITRINQWVQHGTGGYRAMLDATKERS